ncbi:hypothetical protein [Polymorphospora rubra]|uniref:hypothetical protein n=1 Tax=Polymorphospora rubra TaxID=338584 RepID=UPI003F4CDC51
MDIVWASSRFFDAADQQTYFDEKLGLRPVELTGDLVAVTWPSREESPDARGAG